MQKIVYTIGIVLTMSLTACEQAEMVKYEAGERINFYGYTESHRPSDDVTYLLANMNFGINKLGDSLKVDTLRFGVKITGPMTDHPRKVAFVLQNKSDNDKVEIVFEDEYIVPANTGTADFKAVVKRPAKRNLEYIAALTFDYDRSDFEAGTIERQTFALKISDVVNMETLGISKYYWENQLYLLGKWSETKARFIITTLGRTSFAGWAETGFLIYIDVDTLRTALATYKANANNPPLLDDEGNWITF